MEVQGTGGLYQAARRGVGLGEGERERTLEIYLFCIYHVRYYSGHRI